MPAFLLPDVAATAVKRECAHDIQGGPGVTGSEWRRLDWLEKSHFGVDFAQKKIAVAGFYAVSSNFYQSKNFP
ncbi:hypothetical protein [Rhizobium sp. AN80A]|uniref:hypothetical protein n=1 Tax=Rhizobium sp. AN80A TaxID=3040673 RepID=UPI0024B36980|nr:hypothetical protein [Rhizobium sp. AN80A]